MEAENLQTDLNLDAANLQSGTLETNESNFENESSKSDESNSDYGKTSNIEKLQRPSSILVNIVGDILTTFNSSFDNFKCSKGLIKKTKILAQNKINEKYNNWLNKESDLDDCFTHRQFILTHLLHIKLYKFLLWESDKIQRQSITNSENKRKPRKLAIVSHY
ncbi:hypothetical protein FQA39_LY12272 [Lamprigera yunnana]|nr:hypothetical protein FQA39_LY12272 [Lamprigera yunnana]